MCVTFLSLVTCVCVAFVAIAACRIKLYFSAFGNQTLLRRPPTKHPPTRARMRLAAALSALLAGAHGAEVLGYLENWNDVIWWDNGIPNNCVQGCFDVQAMINKTTPYSAVNYGFVFFTQQPTPNQNGCAEIVNKTTGKVLKTPAQACPVWDGKALYMSSAEKDGSHAVDEKTDIQNMTAGLTAIAEVVRLGRMHPAGPKRTKITLGGAPAAQRTNSR